MSNFPPFDQIKTLDPPIKGALDLIPAYLVLKWAFETKFEGRIIFQRGQRIKHVYFSQGHIVQIRSNLIFEELDVLIKRYTELSKDLLDWLEDFLSRAGNFKSSLDKDTYILEALQNHLSDEEIDRLQSAQFMEQIIDLFGWFFGNYSMNKEKKLPHAKTWMPKTPFIFSKLEDFIIYGRLPLLSIEQFQNDLNQDILIHQKSVCQLLSFISAKKLSGFLSLSRDHALKKIKFEQGKVVSVQSSDPAQTLEQIIHRSSLIPSFELEEIVLEKKKTGKRLRDLLMDQNKIDAKQMKNLLFTLHTERILEAFSWKSGTASFQFEGSKPSIMEPFLKSPSENTNVRNDAIEGTHNEKLQSELESDQDPHRTQLVHSLDLKRKIVFISLLPFKETWLMFPKFSKSLQVNSKKKNYEKVMWLLDENEIKSFEKEAPTEDIFLHEAHLISKDFFEVDMNDYKTLISPLLPNLDQLDSKNQYVLLVPKKISKSQLFELKTQLDEQKISWKGFYTI